MTNTATTEIAMNLIVHAGNAKSKAMEAIYVAKTSDFEAAKEKFKEANESINKAHNAQTKLITDEANGQHTDINILLIHAQDHLMTAIGFIDLAQQLVEFHEIALVQNK